MRSAIILKLKTNKRTMFTQTCVFILLQLQLFMFSSAEELSCSITRLKAGDRILFVDYNGTCITGVNPCQKIDGSEWKFSAQGCICQCNKLTSTYREDNRSCVVNKLNRKGCTLLFIKERVTDALKVFNNSSSIKLNALLRESCVAKETYYITDGITSSWEQLLSNTPAFSIRHENRKKNRHAHFLEWKNRQSVPALFGKIVKVKIECQITKRGDSDRARKLCIVFKVKGSISLPCTVGIPLPYLPTNVTSTTVTTMIPDKTRLSNETTQKSVTDVVTKIVEPNTTPYGPSNIDKGDRESHNIGEKVALPIWLIAVITGGAVIATLSITAIVWICCRMKRRSRKKQSRRSKLGNPLYSIDDDTVVTFAQSGGGSRVDEAGYDRVGSPCRKGYTFLNPGPERTTCRSEYQRLVKPDEDPSGYLLPMEGRSPPPPTTPTPAATECPSTVDTAIYSEAISPPPQDKPKEYDYAKAEDVICLTASRSSLDKLDAHEKAKAEPGYVETMGRSEGNDIVSPSPLYAVVEGPSSPGLSADGASKDLPAKDTPDIDPKPDYLEILPDTGSESGNYLIKEHSEA